MILNGVSGTGTGRNSITVGDPNRTFQPCDLHCTDFIVM